MQQQAPAVSHQAAQATLAALAVREVVRVWHLLDVGHLAASLPQFAAVVAALVQHYGTASAGLAARFYEEARAAAGVRGPFTAVPASPPGLDQVEAELKWATRNLWSATPDVQAARTLVTGAADRMVLDTGRETVTGAVQHDRRARGWARVTEPRACSFCLLLATRGAAYRSEQTAEFRSHDHCRCHVEPVFGAYEPTAEIRHWQAVYREATRGKSGQDARNAFRQAVVAQRAAQ